MSEKLQKVLARAGLGSRREIEGWIAAGRITVDGEPARLGDRVEPQQVVRVDGRVVAPARTAARRRILLYHKPEGELCTRSDPQGRPTIFEHLPPLRDGRWISVGRLDYNSAGLLLLTTDGELAHRLMHPSTEIEREYAARVLGAVDDEALARLRTGVQLADGPARFESIEDGGGAGANHWYRVTLKEGRNREVRRMFEAVGAQVNRLIRVRYGPVALPRDLHLGQWRDVDAAAAHQLLVLAGLAAPAAESERPTRRAKPARGAPRQRPAKPAGRAGTGTGRKPARREAQARPRRR